MPESIKFSAQGGTVENGVFLTQQAGTASITMEAGNARGTAQVRVLSAPESITVIREQTGKDASGTGVMSGVTLSLTAKAYYAGKTVYAEDESFTTVVAPSFRPDKAVNIHKAGWSDYMQQLSKAVNKPLSTIADVLSALEERLVHFKNCGCRASDHGLDYVPYRDYTVEQADAVYQKGLRGEKLTTAEIEGYQTVILKHLGGLYNRMGIVMQIHYSCLRNNNGRIFKLQGGDTGVDAIAQNTCGGNISHLLSDLDEAGCCPKVVLYSLNPADNAQLGSLIGCFQDSTCPGKVQHGSAWWFNDNKTGMTEQMISLANLGILGNFIGMLTDSRSFLSYPRHEYFRRILCNLIGTWVENGEYPANENALKKIVEGISYYNAKRYFEL